VSPSRTEKLSLKHSCERVLGNLRVGEKIGLVDCGMWETLKHMRKEILKDYTKALSSFSVVMYLEIGPQCCCAQS
jgi:hypothetical protein